MEVREEMNEADSFKKFKDTIRRGEAIGEIRTSKPLTDFDLAVQWAVGRIGKRKGYPCDITTAEIWQEIYPIFEDDAQTVADFLNT